MATDTPPDWTARHTVEQDRVIRERHEEAAKAAAAAPSTGDPSVKRSWRRKYRKMRHKFEERMRESNDLIRSEHKLTALAQRLQEQNDQLLDLLLDLNDNIHIPAHLRYELKTPPPSESAVPSLEPDEPVVTADPSKAVKKLDDLLSIPHTTYPPEDELPSDLKDEEYPLPGYLTPNHEEEYLLALDNALQDPATNNQDDASGRPIRPSLQPSLTEKDLTMRNPDSVYNWLRRHQPQVFLQDNENASEKSGANPGGKRASGKRHSTANVATPAKSEQEGLDEDIGFDAQAAAGSARGKRTSDDAPYRPNRGGRGNKRKREDGADKGPRKKKSMAGLSADIS